MIIIWSAPRFTRSARMDLSSSSTLRRERVKTIVLMPEASASAAMREVSKSDERRIPVLQSMTGGL